MSTSRYELDEIADEIRHWRAAAGRDDERLSAEHLAAFIAGQTDDKDALLTEARLKSKPNLKSAVECVRKVMSHGEWKKEILQGSTGELHPPARQRRNEERVGLREKLPWSEIAGSVVVDPNAIRLGADSKVELDTCRKGRGLSWRVLVTLASVILLAAGGLWEAYRRPSYMGGSTDAEEQIASNENTGLAAEDIIETEQARRLIALLQEKFPQLRETEVAIQRENASLRSQVGRLDDVQSEYLKEKKRVQELESELEAVEAEQLATVDSATEYLTELRALRRAASTHDQQIESLTSVRDQLGEENRLLRAHVEEYAAENSTMQGRLAESTISAVAGKLTATDPQYIIATRYLGKAYLAAGNEKEAQKCLDEAKSAAESVFGTKHLITADCWQELAYTHLPLDFRNRPLGEKPTPENASEYQTLLSFLGKSVEIRRALGLTHTPEYLDCQLAMARLLLCLDKSNNAESCIRAVLDVREEFSYSGYDSELLNFCKWLHHYYMEIAQNVTDEARLAKSQYYSAKIVWLEEQAVKR